MCHYPFHLPLPVILRSLFHLPTLVLFHPSISPLFLFSVSLYLHPSSSSTPPTPRCVSPLLGKKEKCCGRREWEEDKTEKRVKEEKIVKAGVCLERGDASIHHEPDLMEYPRRQRVEGGRRRRRKRRSRGGGLKNNRTEKAGQPALASGGYGDTEKEQKHVICSCQSFL